MSEQSSWEKSNDEYLSAALAWLRLRLERFCEEEEAGTAIPFVPPSEETEIETEENNWFQRLLSWLFHLIGRSSSKPSDPSEQRVSTHPGEEVTDEMLSQAESRMQASETLDPPPALVILERLFGLSRFEIQLLLLCAATELDTRIPALCDRAQGNKGHSYPTFALSFALFDDPAWDVLSPESRLRYWKLLSVDGSEGLPLITSPLRLEQRILDYIKGLSYLDGLLAPLTIPLDVSANGLQLPPSQAAVAEKVVDFLMQFKGMQHLPVIQLLGPDKYCKQLVAQEASLRLGLHLCRMPAYLLPAPPVELDDLARLWERERILQPIALYVDAPEAEAGQEGKAQPLGRFLAKSHGVVFLDTRDIWPGLTQSKGFEVSKPTPVEQEEAWAGALGENAGDCPSILAGQFNLNLAFIEKISSDALADNGSSISFQKRLWQSCLTSTRPRLDLLAQRLDPKAKWDDIVLTKNEDELLRQIASQVRNRNLVYDKGGFRRKMNRGLGIGVLFAGESGTGKTMAAEVIANELHLDLYRIDLSQVVSKYIGETEKNLKKLFDAAEEGGAILFFDEADSLFGKRSEVKDSHDRYANIEINYLLQRMESFNGLAILATNRKGDLDKAFMRRLRFIVDFPYPGPSERKWIWQKAFPDETKVDALDYERLAMLNLTGGSIHNIALNSAFLAAEAKTAVKMQQVLAAAKVEFRKLEKPVIESDFLIGGSKA